MEASQIADEIDKIISEHGPVDAVQLLTNLAVRLREESAPAKKEAKTKDG